MQMYFIGMSVKDIANHYEMMGIKKSDTALIGGHQTFYNYTKKYIGLGGKTPAEDSNKG